MQSNRREFLLKASALGAAAISWPVQAAPLFDSIFMFVPAAPGGGWDGTARAIEQACKAADLVGSFQFENVGGSGGMVGLPRFVNQRKGQGNALMVAGSVMVGAAISAKSPITIQNSVPIAKLTEESGVVVVPANSPFKSFGELVAAFKADPRKVPVAGGSAGGTDHILLGLMLKALGRNPKEGAYVAFAGGGPANAAIIGGQVAAGISGYSEFEEQIKGGRMRALAVSGEARIPGVSVPTLREQGMDVVAANWRGVFGAPGITPAQRGALEKLITAMRDTAGWKDILTKRRWADTFQAGGAFEKYVAQDVSDTVGVMKDLGLA
ncbi:MAG: Bug family tripartite tricarboxylate transporter substrate binding protein [Burkholderiales bacterium]